MERIHPNLSYAAACAMVALSLGLCGCRSSSSGIAGSPFMSPDRVPPPNTRQLMPGQAQPYYQGDPLPAMQSAANPNPTAIAALPSEAETRTPSGRTLSWTQRGNTPQPATAGPPPAPPGQVAVAAAPVPQLQPQPQPQQVAGVNEGTVAVPIDGDPLRFPLPTAQPAETAAPIASAVPIATQPIVPVAPQQPANVQLASYNAPMQSAPPLPTSVAASPQQQVASPWRAPQIAQSTAPPVNMQPVAGQQYAGAPSALPAPPTPIPADTMSATLRAVDSPAQPGDPMPRVRMPGYVASQASADGFRPRSSMQ